MVDNWTGKWYPEDDYSTYPKEKWCDCDKLCNAIREDGYEPETDMENLITICFLHFDSWVEDNKNNEELMNDLAKRSYSENVQDYVMDEGGWDQFDYYC